jgi:Fe(3+) dicitrate transport protein
MLDLHVLKLIKGGHKNHLNVFCTYALNHARYLNGTVVLGKTNLDISGNKVEDVPDYIFRSGITFKSSHIMVSLLYSKTGQMVSDANNTIFNSNGITGIIPSFHIMDFTCAYQFLKRYNVKLSVNNLENKIYFNRRVSNYLGPGILPAAGRSIVLTVSMKF